MIKHLQSIQNSYYTAIELNQSYILIHITYKIFDK